MKIYNLIKNVGGNNVVDDDKIDELLNDAIGHYKDGKQFIFKIKLLRLSGQYPSQILDGKFDTRFIMADSHEFLSEDKEKSLFSEKRSEKFAVIAFLTAISHGGSNIHIPEEASKIENLLKGLKSINMSDLNFSKDVLDVIQLSLDKTYSDSSEYIKNNKSNEFNLNNKFEEKMKNVSELLSLFNPSIMRQRFHSELDAMRKKFLDVSSENKLKM